MSDIGSHTLIVKAAYANVDNLQTNDPSYGKIEFETQDSDVTLEPSCPITSFQNNPAESTIEEFFYDISDGAQGFTFGFLFEDQSCNFVKSYKLKLGGVDVESLPWITVVPDSGGNPAQVVVSTGDVSLIGYHSLSITSLLNTTPVEVSTDEYQFIVNIQSSEPCATIEFERQDLQLAFEIAPAATPATLTFDEFSY